LRATGSHDAAKDAFQTVMSAVFEKRASFQGGHYAAWLFTIARNHVLKVSKRQQRDVKTLSPIDDGAGNEQTFLSNGNFAVRSGASEGDFLLQEALDRAIAQLPEDLREAFELKQYDGLQHEEIAQTLGISLSLAKVRVFRAKRQLQRLLAPFFEELQ
jgi:RNA polymerase sigma-70 factor (ECF subfamily)